MRFSAYGIHIESNVPLAGLPAAIGEPATTVKLKSSCIHHAATPSGIGKAVSGWRDICCKGGENPIFSLGGVGKFHLSPQESTIYCDLRLEASLETVRYWFIHFVLPVYLLLDVKYEFLHASAVKIDGGGVAFLADSMGGKSTLADFFVRQGHSLLTDEHLGILRENCFLAVPSVPFIRPYRREEDIGKPVECFSSQPVPLRAVYLLELNEGPARVVPLTGLSVVSALGGNRQLVVSKKFANLTKARFARLAEMAASIPVAKLYVPRDLSRLPEAYATVLSHLGERRDSL